MNFAIMKYYRWDIIWYLHKYNIPLLDFLILNVINLQIFYAPKFQNKHIMGFHIRF
jgi:hypothetical protein